MFCHNCGAENPNTATRCSKCGASPAGSVNPYASSSFSASQAGNQYGGVPTGCPPNYLVHSILITVLCCLPFGVVALVYAAQVESKWSSGDYAGAMSASNSAKLWCQIAFGGWCLLILLYLGIFAFAFLTHQIR
ncbi:MAG: CD225/dispanin family protein [Pirellulales bacterium]